MSDFIDTDAGFINTDSIVRMRNEKVPGKTDYAGRPLRRTRVCYRDEHGAPQYTWASSDPECVCGNVVAATPGYYAIGAWRDPETGNADIWKMPIVAWRVLGGCAYPVCFDDTGRTEDAAILTPDGRVVVPFECAHDTVEGYLAEHAPEKAGEGKAA